MSSVTRFVLDTRIRPDQPQDSITQRSAPTPALVPPLARALADLVPTHNACPQGLSGSRSALAGRRQRGDRQRRPTQPLLDRFPEVSDDAARIGFDPLWRETQGENAVGRQPVVPL